MNLHVAIEELLPHSAEDVWAALTDADAIADWLMVTTGFDARVGACFKMKTQHLSADGWVHAKVLELDPPTRMAWAWSPAGATVPTIVTFDLSPADGGTLLRLTHVGEIETEIGRLLGEGWPGRIDLLRRNLDRAHGRTA